MTQPIEDAILQIATVVAGVTGIQGVPINPPETVSLTTFGLVYAESGILGINSMGESSLGSVGNRASFHQIAVDILTTRSDLADNIAFMKPFIDTIGAALLGEVSASGTLFSGTITTMGRITYEWVNPKIAGVQYTGYHFTMNEVKILIDS